MLLDDGSVYQGSDLEDFNNALMVDNRVVDVACGGYGSTTYVLLEDGSVRVFGDNIYGSCDVPEIGDLKIKQIACGANHTCLLLNDGIIRVFGGNHEGQCE